MTLQSSYLLVILIVILLDKLVDMYNSLSLAINSNQSSGINMTGVLNPIVVAHNRYIKNVDDIFYSYSKFDLYTVLI